MSLLLAPLILAAAPLTLDEAVAEALRRNETSGITQAQISQAEADLRAAWAALLPTADLSATYTRRRLEARSTVAEGTPQERDIVIRAKNALNGRILVQTMLFDAPEIPNIQSAKDELEAREDQSESELRRFAFSVARVFLSVVVFERTQAAAQERLELAQDILADVQQRAEAGLTSTNDVSRSRLELASARLTLTEADNSVVQARLQLGFLMGRPVDEALTDPVLVGGQPEDVPASVQRALRARPDFSALVAQVQAARRRALEPWLRLVPSIQGEADFTLTNETGFQERELNYNLSLIAAWPIYDGGVRYADAKRSSARLDELQLELQRLERTVELSIRSSLAERARALAAVDQAKARVEVAEVNAEEVGERFRAGLATALEQADANVQLFEARARLESSRFELSQAELAVLEARGGVPPGFRSIPSL